MEFHGDSIFDYNFYFVFMILLFILFVFWIFYLCYDEIKNCSKDFIVIIICFSFMFGFGIGLMTKQVVVDCTRCEYSLKYNNKIYESRFDL